MEGVTELHIAKNLEDLKRVAKPDKLSKNPKILERAVKSLYNEILRENSDQERCYIFCLRFFFLIKTLGSLGDEKFYKIIYSSEQSRVNNKFAELEQILEKRYELESLHALKKSIDNNKISVKPSTELKSELIPEKQQLFPTEFIYVKELYLAIQDNANMLIVDIRPANEYSESKIKFENIINIPEDVIVPGLSANVLGQKLKDETQKIWDKRDSFEAIVFIDWNSSTENITSSKLKYLKDSIVEWDCLRKYKQHPVIINGGFKEFLESYPGSVTNVHVNFIRSNEDIDELLELDNISYPEPDQNVSIMPLKQFTLEQLEESTNNEGDMDEEPENGRFQDEDISSSTSSSDDIRPISPKGGGADLSTSSVNFINEEPTYDYKSKIEEERLKLLMEARNKKNMTVSNDNKENLIGDNIGRRPEYEVKRSVLPKPPTIRRDTKPLKISYTFGGWCGLVNIKNTCYMNTILQCLKCIPGIRNFLHSNYTNHITRKRPQIINEFASVIKVLCEGTEIDKKVHRPSDFYDVVCRLEPTYKKGNHEDCMEFFLFLFSHLNDDFAYDIKKTSVMIEREKAWYNQLQGRTSLWVDLFYHQFKSTKICQTCHSTADSYETDNTLMLPVPYRPGLRMVYLKNLIDEYMEDNQILDYKCSKCQNLGVINVKEVVVAPEILVIVLKRYYQDEYQESRKNNVCVVFDFNFVFGNSEYTLYSVAEHRGTMEHGHYFAHGNLNGTWVELNDERTARYTGDWENIRGSVCAFFYSKVVKTHS